MARAAFFARTLRQPARRSCRFEAVWSTGAGTWVSLLSVITYHRVVCSQPRTRIAPEAHAEPTDPAGPDRHAVECELVEDAAAFVAHRPTATDRPRRIAFVDGHHYATEARLTRTSRKLAGGGARAADRRTA